MPESAAVSPLDAHVGYWLRFVSNHVSHAFEMKLRDQGVTVAEWVLLRELLRLGPASPARLADEMGMTRGAISKVIDRAHRSRLITRTADKRDRRGQTVALTAAGKKLVPALARRADENDRAFFSHLSDRQRTQLLKMLKNTVRVHGWKDMPVK